MTIFTILEFKGFYTTVLAELHKSEKFGPAWTVQGSADCSPSPDQAYLSGLYNRHPYNSNDLCTIRYNVFIHLSLQ